MSVVEHVPRGPRGVAILGIIIGVIGLELALPPAQVRAAGVPVVLGVAAMACALWALIRREWRLGVWAALVAVCCHRVRGLGAGQERHVRRRRC